MAGTLVVRSAKDGTPLEFRVLSGPLERMRGLLGTQCDAAPVALVPCRSIHTFGMRYPIDVAFVSKRGLVLGAAQNVGPARLLAARGARLTLEQPHGRGRWFERGETLAMGYVGVKEAKGRGNAT